MRKVKPGSDTGHHPASVSYASFGTAAVQKEDISNPARRGRNAFAFRIFQFNPAVKKNE
jgi:hypothetical protein